MSSVIAIAKIAKKKSKSLQNDDVAAPASSGIIQGDLRDPKSYLARQDEAPAQPPVLAKLKQQASDASDASDGIRTDTKQSKSSRVGAITKRRKGSRLAVSNVSGLTEDLQKMNVRKVSSGNPP